MPHKRNKSYTEAFIEAFGVEKKVRFPVVIRFGNELIEISRKKRKDKNAAQN